MATVSAPAPAEIRLRRVICMTTSLLPHDRDCSCSRNVIRYCGVGRRLPSHLSPCSRRTVMDPSRLTWLPDIRQAISRRNILVGGALLTTAGASGAWAQTVLGAGKTPSHLRFLQPDGSSKQAGYTHVVEATVPGRIVYIAGQLGLDSNGNIVGAPGDFKAQATQAYENMRNALAAAGGGL